MTNETIQPEINTPNQAELETKPPISSPNTLELVGWMYPKMQIAEIDGIDDNLAPFVAEIIKERLVFHKAELGFKTYRIFNKAVARMNLWLEGQTIAKIAQEEGATDGSVRISLDTLAAKLGQLSHFEDLLQVAKDRLAEEEAAQAAVAKTNGIGQKMVFPDGYEGIMTGLNIEDGTVTSTFRPTDSYLVLTAVRDALVEAREAKLQEVYFPPLEIHENFEPELITLLNVTEEPLHIDEIFKTMFGRYLNAHQVEEISFRIDGLVNNGSIIDLGDGFYSTYKAEV